MEKPSYEHLRARLSMLEAKQRESAVSLLWGVYAQSPIPTFMIGSEGDILAYNEAMVRLSGYIHREIPDLTAWLTKVFPDPAYRTKVTGIIRKARARDTGMKRYMFTITRKDGKKRYVELSVYDIRDADGVVNVQVVQGIDVTVRRQSEKMLAHMKSGTIADNQQPDDDSSGEPPAQEVQSAVSERIYRDLVENVDDVLYADDDKGVIQYISPNVEKLSGYRAEELIGRQFSEILFQEDVPVYRTIMEQVQKGGSERADIRIRTRAGEVCWVRASTKPIYSGDRFTGVQGVIADITDRKLQEEYLASNEQWYRAMFELTSLGVLSVSPAGVIDRANVAAASILGYKSPDDLLNRKAVDVFASQREHDGFIQALRETGEIRAGECSLVRYDGRVFTAVADAFFRSDGQEGSWDITFRDVTEERNLADSREQDALQYRQFIDNSPNPVFAVDSDGLIRIWNPSSEKIFKYGSDIIGNSYQVLIPDEQDFSTVTNLVSQVFNRMTLSSIDITFQSADGSEYVSATRLYPLYAPSGEVKLCVFSNTDITERMRTEGLLRETQSRFRALVDQAADALFVHDRDGHFLDVNQLVCESLEYSRDELLAMSVDDICLAPRIPGNHARAWEKMEPGEHVTYDSVFRRKNGETFPVELRIGIISWDGNEVVLTLARDITDRRRAEAALIESEEKFRSLFETSHDPIFIGSIDGTVEDVNKAWLDLFGYEKDEAIGMDMRILLADPHQRDELLNDVRNNGFVKDIEVAMETKWGQEFDSQVTLTAQYDKSGAITGFHGFTRDVSGRRSMEDALRSSEEKFRNLFNHMSTGVAYYRLVSDDRGEPVDFTFVDVNGAYERMTGRDRRDVVGRKYSDMFPKTDQSWEKTLALVSKVALTGKTARQELRSDYYNGWYRVSFFCPQKGHIVGIYENITVEREAAETLRESERRFRGTFDNLAVGMFHLDPDGRFITVNRRLWNIWGYTEEELRAKTYQELIYPGDLKESLELMCSLLAGNINTFVHEGRFVTRDGMLTWGKTTMALVCDDTGEPSYLVGSLEDISHTKESERHLLEREQRFRTFVEYTGELVTQIDIQGTILYVNDASMQYFGLRSSQCEGLSWFDFVHPEDRDATVSAFHSWMQGVDKKFTYENRLISITKQVHHVQWAVSLIHNKNGALVRINCMARDITGLRQIQQQLSDSEERLRLALDATSDGVWDWRIDEGVFSVNGQWAERMGVDTNQVARYEDWLALIHDDDRVRVADMIKRHLSGETEQFSEEMRMQHSSGSWLWVLSRGRVVERDSAGRSSRMIGTDEDITSRKTGEAALNVSEEKYRALFESSMDGIVLIRGREFVSANKAAMDTFGYDTLEEMKAQVTLESVAPEHRDRVRAMKQDFVDGKPVSGSLEITVLHRNGSLCDLAVGCTVVTLDDERYLLATFRDITERRKFETELRSARDFARNIIMSSLDMIITTDSSRRIVEFNRAAREVFGYTPDEVTGKLVDMLFAKPEDAGSLYETVLLTGRYTGEITSVRKSGDTFPSLLSASLMKDHNGKIIGVVGNLRDITMHKKQQEDLNNALHTKEMLIREVHHRVKNNLQIISSLLMLQSDLIENERYRDIFQESIDRIRTMSVIHEMLYKSDDLGQIDSQEYLGTICENIRKSYVDESSRITLNVDFEEMNCDVERAIICGLILNELISNALKHAFPDDRSGTIDVSFKRFDDGMLELLVRDDGVGISGEIDFEHADTMGLLITYNMVTRQLHGTLTVDRENGTGIRITFPEEH